jgi:hypothetical protein
MLPTVLAALRQTPETNSLIHTFVGGINDAFNLTPFAFSNCTASYFFEPGTKNYSALYSIIADFESKIMLDLINITTLVQEDLQTHPLWAGPDVLPFAEQYIRSAAAHQSAFVISINNRVIIPARSTLALSHRPNAINELRSILMAFGSLRLLTQALATPADRKSFSVDEEPRPAVPHVILRAYLNRVVQNFASEPSLPDGLYVRFLGPMNVAYTYSFEPDVPIWTPMPSASGNAHAALARLLVAAHRTSCCIPGFTNDILTTTRFVVSFFYSSYHSIWAASITPPPAPAPTAAPAPAAAPTAAPAPARADIVQPPTPRPGAPKTPSGRVLTPTESSRTFRPPSAEAMMKAMSATSSSSNGFLARATSPGKTF